ncbi:MAG: hypothetical protein JO213_16740 [Alphaproteobacteria bacterium]|nr:hypothetical protein [Alphaproteobacteria bacterium]
MTVGIVPFAAFTTLVLYHFYIKGGFLWDSGLLAFLIGESDPRLPTPGIIGGGSFFATHFTPIFLALSVIRRLLPVSNPQFFAMFTGLCHALPGLAVFWILYSGFRLHTPRGVIVAAGLSLGFSFNGLALAIALYPHFEMLIVGAAVLFFVALSQRRWMLAACFFLVCLTTREDAGFHLFAVLFLLVALNRWRGIPWRQQRREMGFAIIALAYSITALALQHALFDNQSSFARIYLGDPAFRKLSLALLAERLLGYVEFRTYLVLPAIVTLFWAVYARNPYIVLGYAAFLPWSVLHLLADSDIAGTLSSYYAYPFLIASFWPLLGVLAGSPRREQPATGFAVLAFVAMIAGSFAARGYQANPGGIKLPAAFVSLPSAARQTATERAIGLLVQAKAKLGSVMVDGSVLALVPDGFSIKETFWENSAGSPDTVIYFVAGYESDKARMVAEQAGLRSHYRVPGTSIQLATDRALDAASPLAPLLAPAEASE